MWPKYIGRKYLVVLALLGSVSCTVKEQGWQLMGQIDLGTVTPIGLTKSGDHLWIADGDHNRIVSITLTGEVSQSIDGFDRPMHLTHQNGVLYIPEYGSDRIIQFENGVQTVLALPDSLDAPAGVAVVGEEIAIADFYHHRILFYNGADWLSFGKEGKGKGELYYPTDVSIGADKIWVADAYNNRIQVFDKEGRAIQIIGEAEKMNAATGIYSNAEAVLITDFENDRVLIYNHEGKLLEVLSEGINKPTDLLIEEEVLYIANYKGKNILKWKK
ncbi:MAG: NHL repeat-containing protein [Bacteroidota bacterium]